jgi:DNA-binding transcriptional MerR regulator
VAVKRTAEIVRVAAPASILTITEAAQAVGCSPATVRLWERQGLLHPPRSPSGYRLYDEMQLARLRRIARLRSVDRLNAAAIRRLLTTEGDGPHRQVGPMLGPRLRALRVSHALTLAQAAARVRVSVSFLSALEKGDTGVSVATLRRVLSLYGTTLAEIGSSRTHGPRQLTRAGHRATIDGRFEGVRIVQLAEAPALMEAQIFEVEPGGGSQGGYSHEGEEFVYVLDGAFEVKLGSSRPYRLGRGDCLYYSSTTEHRWKNPGRKTARLMWVNTPPTF